MALRERLVPTGRDSSSEDQRAYRRACLLGAIAAVVVFAGVLAMNGIGFHASDYTTDFHTEQMRSLVHFHWDMPARVLGIEGFERNHKWYMYYGPFPSLFRFPFLAALPDAANHITQWSMLAAFAVALRACSRLLWTVRGWLRPGTTSTRSERLAAGGMIFLIGAGSSLLFLGSEAWIYHETEIWGAALALSAFSAIVAAVAVPSRLGVAMAGAWTAGAILTRGSVGIGPVVALGLLTVALFLGTPKRWLGFTGDVDRRIALWFAGAATIPVFLYCYVNYSRFGNLFVFETASQRMSQINPQRIHFLSHSGGSYFGLKFIPTTLFQYFRPDALRFTTVAPFIDFPLHGKVFGGAVFDAFEPTSSIPSSMPALTLLAIVGLVTVFGRRGREVRPMRAPIVGAVVGALAVLPFGYIANRYLADFVPFVVLAGIVGFHRLAGWWSGRAPNGAAEPGDAAVGTGRKRRGRRAVVVGVAVLAAMSVVSNVALATRYHYTGPWVAEHLSAPFIADAIRLHEKIPGGSVPGVKRVESLPYPPPVRGSVYVVGDCDAVYWSSGRIPSLAWSAWRGVQRSSAAGQYDFDVTFPDRAPAIGVTEPLVVRGTPGRLQTIAIRYAPGGRVNFIFTSQGHDDLPHGPRSPRGFFVDRATKYEPGRRQHLRVIMDPNNGQVRVELDGKVVYRFFQVELTPEQNSTYIYETPAVSFGVNDVGLSMQPRFSGRLDRRKTPQPSLCRDLTASR